MNEEVSQRLQFKSGVDCKTPRRWLGVYTPSSQFTLTKVPLMTHFDCSFDTIHFSSCVSPGKHEGRWCRLNDVSQNAAQINSTSLSRNKSAAFCLSVSFWTRSPRHISKPPLHSLVVFFYSFWYRSGSDNFHVTHLLHSSGLAQFPDGNCSGASIHSNVDARFEISSIYMTLGIIWYTHQINKFAWIAFLHVSTVAGIRE